MAGRSATTPQPQVQGYNSICPAATDIGDRATVNQIYALVNNVFKQMTGRTDIEAVDTNSLVAMGNELENLGRMDIYLGSLSRRIGLTIDSYRTYDNDFSEYKRNSFEWGAAVQKLYADMPDAVEDLTYKVGQMDGQSVDHYIINNPKGSALLVLHHRSGLPPAGSLSVCWPDVFPNQLHLWSVPEQDGGGARGLGASRSRQHCRKRVG